ncbi:pyridoxamine 5'-phosphate oxidase family protein [Nocardioides sp. GCM10027113]|uniref:pyridoxamine 5'-phosphate oxidase family protein n=1 Tax=unclassified Nocardioides TaxID=2615069 RepID=UPI003606C4EC
MDDQEYNEEPFAELTEDECWEQLRGCELGRLAFHLADEVHITPVNYVVDKDTLLFRTAEGSKLLALVMNSDVAFEIDGVDGETATSVIVRGRAELLDEHSAHRADDLPLRPWVANPKYNVVEITPTEISGRRFQLHRPWLRAIPEV